MDADPKEASSGGAALRLQALPHQRQQVRHAPLRARHLHTSAQDIPLQGWTRQVCLRLVHFKYLLPRLSSYQIKKC